MREIQWWEKFFGKAKYGFSVEVKDQKVTVDVDTFNRIVKGAGWALRERIIELEPNKKGHNV